MHVKLDQYQQGAWAEIRDIVPYGLTKNVGKYIGVTQQETLEIMREKGPEFLLLVLRHMVKDWNIFDENGNLVQQKPQDIAESELDKLDGWMLEHITDVAADIVRNRRNGDPNASSAS